MSHEGIRAFDNRTDEEIKRSENKRYLERAKNQLKEEGGLVNNERPVGLIERDRLFFENEARIAARARELKERDEYVKLKRKYG